MMLAFDKNYLASFGLDPDDFDEYNHDAGQPTSHFNVLREKGIDSRRIIVDETAPLYHICENPSYPKMLFIVADNGMKITEIPKAYAKLFCPRIPHREKFLQRKSFVHIFKKSQV